MAYKGKLKDGLVGVWSAGNVGAYKSTLKHEGLGIKVKTNRTKIKFLKRIWILISNPFLYIFTGQIRW